MRVCVGVDTKHAYFPNHTAVCDTHHSATHYKPPPMYSNSVEQNKTLILFSGVDTHSLGCKLSLLLL